MAADRAGSDGDPVTEIGVVVADAWQGHGVGSALVRTLIGRATARGATALAMDVLHGNHEVLAMILGHRTEARTDQSADCVTVHVRLPEHRRHAPAMSPGRRGCLNS